MYKNILLILLISFLYQTDKNIRLKVDRDGAKKKFWIRPLSQESTELSIPFAEFNEQDLSLNNDALKLLATIDKPVAVVTVCGPFRSGKSYYLSRVLGIKSSFKSSPYQDPCTKGMWMATNVLECDDFVVILMDTEGTSSLEGQDRENKVTSLMVLSTLLSSVLIYNSKGPASQNSLNEMRSAIGSSYNLILLKLYIVVSNTQI